MSEKTQKIAAILSCRDVNTQNGVVYYYKLEMEDGSVGEIGKKKQNAFNVGDSLTYTTEETQYGLKFKAVQNGAFAGRSFNGGGSRGGNESFALSYSKDLHVAMIGAGITGAATSEQIKSSIMKTAKEFLDWLNDHKA